MYGNLQKKLNLLHHKIATFEATDYNFDMVGKKKNNTMIVIMFGFITQSDVVSSASSIRKSIDSCMLQMEIEFFIFRFV